MQAATLQALEQAFGVKALGVQDLPAAQEALLTVRCSCRTPAGAWRLGRK